MGQSFLHTSGRVFSVDLDADAIERVRHLLEIDLAAMAGDLGFIENAFGDAETLRGLVLAIVFPQLGVTVTTFDDATLQRARSAILSAMIVAFPGSTLARSMAPMGERKPRRVDEYMNRPRFKL